MYDAECYVCATIYYDLRIFHSAELTRKANAFDGLARWERRWAGRGGGRREKKLEAYPDTGVSFDQAHCLIYGKIIL
jgi:hypothetical protein